METERIALSQRDRDRLKVLHDVRQKHLTQVQAAQRLRVTDRHVRRLLLALHERGDAALVHGLRGRPSNRKLAPGTAVNCVAALRFFFVKTLKRHQFRKFLPYPKDRCRLPTVLSLEEVSRLINAAGHYFGGRCR